MPTYEVTQPDGSTYEIYIPEPSEPRPEDQVYHTIPREEAIQEAFPTSFMPRLEKAGETGAFLGELGGAVAGGMIPGGQVVRGVGRVLGAGLGAGTVSQLERRLRGAPLSLEQGTTEALFSLIPQAGEELVRAAGRGLLRVTRGGRELQSDEAARIASSFAQRTYDPPNRRQASQLFQMIEQQNVTGSLAPAQQYLGQFAEGPRRRRLVREVRALDPEAFDVMEAGGDLPLSRLQELRSYIGQQAENVGTRTGGARLQRDLRDVRSIIDQSIDASLDAIDLPELGRTARTAWHQLKAAERLSEVITTSPVTKIINQGDGLEFNLESLLQRLQDNRSRRFRQVNQDLDKLPGARAAFESYLDDLKNILPRGKLEFSDVSGLRRIGLIGAADRMVSHVITSPLGQRLFRDAAVYGRGRMSVNTLATIYNHVRRQSEGGDQAIPMLGENVAGASTLGQALALPHTQPGMQLQPGQIPMR